MTPKQAAFLIILGALFMSFVGLFVRLIDSADGFQILFYRALSVVPFVVMVICLRRRIGLIKLCRALDIHDLIIGIFLSLAFSFFIFAVLNTSIASALFILTAAPLLAAILAIVFIRENPHPLTWVAIVMALLGVYLMIGDGMGTGQTLGNIFALLAGFSFACMLVFARKGGRQDILGGTLVASILSGLFGLIYSLTLGSGLSISSHDFWMVFLLGLLTVAPGITCITWGTPYLPAAEVSLLVLAESALGPIWVWVFGFERITLIEFIGGGIVISAVIAVSQITRNSTRT